MRRALQVKAGRKNMARHYSTRDFSRLDADEWNGVRRVKFLIEGSEI
jgi:hypothetical protein